MNKKLLADILKHARAEIPKEACGLVVKGEYIPCVNLSTNNDDFVIAPMDYVRAEAKGEITHVVHSHPTSAPTPSEADLAGMESTGIEWIIVNPETGEYTETKPKNYVSPLTERRFVYDQQDCWALSRDYYQRIFGISLLDYDRPMKRDFELGYMETCLIDCGFVKVPELEMHDLITMSINSRGPDPVSNHIAIYTGNKKILHHLFGHKSGYGIWGGYWQDAATGFWRRRK